MKDIIGCLDRLFEVDKNGALILRWGRDEPGIRDCGYVRVG